MIEIDEEQLKKLPCPQCNTQGSLKLENRLVAKPLGSYSIAGAQPKVVATQVPHLVCTKEGCGFTLRAKKEEK
jgi:hypothetical protein